MAKAAKSQARRKQRAKKAAMTSDDVQVFAIDVPDNLSAEELDMFWENLFADKISVERPHPSFPLPKRDAPH